MITKEHAHTIIAGIEDELDRENDEDNLREWSESHGLDGEFFIEAVQAFTEGVRFLHETGQADFRQAVLSCITTAFISGYTLGESRVQDSALPDIDNVLEDDPE